MFQISNIKPFMLHYKDFTVKNKFNNIMMFRLSIFLYKNSNIDDIVNKLDNINNKYISTCITYKKVVEDIMNKLKQLGINVYQVVWMENNKMYPLIKLRNLSENRKKIIECKKIIVNEVVMFDNVDNYIYKLYLRNWSTKPVALKQFNNIINIFNNREFNNIVNEERDTYLHLNFTISKNNVEIIYQKGIGINYF